MSNLEKFTAALTDAYRKLFLIDPKYSYVRTLKSPAELAEAVTMGIKKGEALHTGSGVQMACMTLGIKHSLKSIKEYLR